MEKLSGLVLDVFDDPGGEVLKQLFPTTDDLPEVLKTAMPLTAVDRSKLPDDVFALVLQDGDVTLRKYACVDKGNTCLNIEYFLKTAHKLPEDAQKVAADNLFEACRWYDIEPPEDLKKLSTGNIPTVGRQRFWQDSDGSVGTHNDQSWETEKAAEVVGSYDMPSQSAPSKRNPNEKPKPAAMPPKVATIDDELEAGFKEASGQERKPQGEEADTNIDMSHGEQPAALPQNKKVLTPHVDVTSHQPPKVVKEKIAQHYAMPSICRYPLDGLHQVKVASIYFDENYKEMEPPDRREFASNLVKRAHAISMPVSDVAEHYGAPGYAPRVHIMTELAAREDLVKEAEDRGLYDELKERVGELPPDVFAHALWEIDKHAGIDEAYDKDCMDPWYTVFGTEKVAADVPDPKDSVVLGAEYMKVPDLVEFAQSKPKMIEARFGKDFCSEFQKDPAGIFDTLPRDQKIIVMRMVNNSPNSMQGASVS